MIFKYFCSSNSPSPQLSWDWRTPVRLCCSNSSLLFKPVRNPSSKEKKREMSVNAVQYIPAVLTLPKPSSSAHPTKNPTHAHLAGHGHGHRGVSKRDLFVTDAPNLHHWTTPPPPPPPPNAESPPGRTASLCRGMRSSFFSEYVSCARDKDTYSDI